MSKHLSDTQQKIKPKVPKMEVDLVLNGAVVKLPYEVVVTNHVDTVKANAKGVQI